ncbi:MAG: hypothetical protein H6721_07985 [Sandaracinus sp.]|nr:hypothetical protein [Myxococcales bacterium]MCB9632058.1 hypothetical protein [Sandaracinus sp.]
MRIAFAVLLALGCNPEPLPAVHAGGPAPEGGEHVALDPIRRDYAVVLEGCERKRAELEAQIEDEHRREAGLATLAVAAAVVGEATDVPDDSDVDTGMGGQPPCPQDRDPERGMGPCAQPTLSPEPAGSPARARRDQLTGDARMQIRTINELIDGMDAMLFETPDVSTWTSEQQDAWREQRRALAARCGFEVVD